MPGGLKGERVDFSSQFWVVFGGWAGRHGSGQGMFP